MSNLLYMAVTHERLLSKIEELSLLDSKPVPISTLAKHFKCPLADIIVLLHELEKWHFIKLSIQNASDPKAVGKGEVILL